MYNLSLTEPSTFYDHSKGTTVMQLHTLQKKFKELNGLLYSTHAKIKKPETMTKREISSHLPKVKTESNFRKKRNKERGKLNE